MTLTDQQQEMISDLLVRTTTTADIEDFADRILGNAFGNEETKTTYIELAELKLERLKH